MAKAKNQRDRREHRLFVDQHDRIYDGIIEKETGDPCEVLRPRYRAPWRLPENYHRYRVDPTDLQYVFLDYDGFIEDMRQAHDSWKRRLISYGRKMSGQAFNPNKPTPEVMEVVGPPPMSPVPAIMAKRGDAWVLGLSDERPQWANLVFAQELPLDEKLLAEHLGKLPEVKTPAKGPGRQRGGRRMQRALAGASAS